MTEYGARCSWSWQNTNDMYSYPVNLLQPVNQTCGWPASMDANNQDFSG